MADREQTRRIVAQVDELSEKLIERNAAIQTIKTKLEQAERERDEALELLAMERQLLDDGRVAYRIEKEARMDAEARLAKVPALVEAIASALTSLGTRPLKDGYAAAVLTEALAAFEEPGVPS